MSTAKLGALADSPCTGKATGTTSTTGTATSTATATALARRRLSFGRTMHTGYLASKGALLLKLLSSGAWSEVAAADDELHRRRPARRSVHTAVTGRHRGAAAG